jgi:hypothetical protein
LNRSIALGLAALAMGPWPAALAACRGLDPVTPEVRIRTEEPPPPRIVAAAQAEIRRRTEQDGRGAPADAVTRGLTIDELRTETGYTLATATLPDGSRCVALKGIQAKVGSGGLTVLIDRRYQPGTCQYQAILEHEQQHVRINAEALTRTGRLLEQRLRAVANDWAGRWVPESEAKEIAAAVNDPGADSVRVARDAADAKHARLDSPESYAAVQARCDRW